MRLVKIGSYRPGCTLITDGKDRWPRPSGARNEELVCKWHIVLSKAQNASHEVTIIGLSTSIGSISEGSRSTLFEWPQGTLRVSQNRQGSVYNICYKKIIFVSWFHGLYRGSVVRRRKSLVRHPVELNRGTPLAFPMGPGSDFWRHGSGSVAAQIPDMNRRERCKCASVHTGCSSPI